jgi:hypothetical protein
LNSFKEPEFLKYRGIKKPTKYSTNKSVEFKLDFREIQRPTKIANGMFVDYSVPSRS